MADNFEAVCFANSGEISTDGGATFTVLDAFTGIAGQKEDRDEDQNRL